MLLTGLLLGPVKHTIRLQTTVHDITRGHILTVDTFGIPNTLRSLYDCFSGSTDTSVFIRRPALHHLQQPFQNAL